MLASRNPLSIAKREPFHDKKPQHLSIVYVPRTLNVTVLAPSTIVMARSWVAYMALGSRLFADVTLIVAL